MPTVLLRDVIAQFAGEVPDVDVVDANVSRAELHEATHEYDASVVLLGLKPDELPTVCKDFLDEFPHVGLVGLGADGHTVIHLNDMGPRELVVAIRAARSILLRKATDGTDPDGRGH